MAKAKTTFNREAERILHQRLWQIRDAAYNKFKDEFAEAVKRLEDQLNNRKDVRMFIARLADISGQLGELGAEVKAAGVLHEGSWPFIRPDSKWRVDPYGDDVRALVANRDAKIQAATRCYEDAVLKLASVAPDNFTEVLTALADALAAL